MCTSFCRVALCLCPCKHSTTLFFVCFVFKRALFPRSTNPGGICVSFKDLNPRGLTAPLPWLPLVSCQGPRVVFGLVFFSWVCGSGHLDAEAFSRLSDPGTFFLSLLCLFRRTKLDTKSGLKGQNCHLIVLLFWVLVGKHDAFFWAPSVGPQSQRNCFLNTHHMD